VFSRVTIVTRKIKYLDNALAARANELQQPAVVDAVLEKLPAAILNQLLNSDDATKLFGQK